MPVLTVPVEPDGALVEILIGLGRPQMRTLRRALRPIPPRVALRALLDTGAESTCVDPRAVASLSLIPSNVGFANAPALGGAMVMRSLEAELTIVHPSGKAALNFVLAEWPVVELSLGTLGYQALIGRDVLARCLLALDGPAGTLTLGY